ncbi:hypothetical protein ATANTOWER_005177 [Ataeniobius toweri]|uniref:WW domain-containing protein n=2 Tax=Goodeidae TaxID=28758 RepID=A0ABU7AFG7_9TELE|nr:hypothetical protein [Ataeniobius toweri]
MRYRGAQIYLWARGSCCLSRHYLPGRIAQVLSYSTEPPSRPHPPTNPSPPEQGTADVVKERTLSALQHAGELGRQWSQRSAQTATITVNYWWGKYEEFVGLNEVREAQTKVTQAEAAFMVARGIVREAHTSLEALQGRLKEVRDRLDRVSREEPHYLELATMEHKLLQEERRLRTAYENAESSEREKFALFSAAVRESHEKERTRAERTKNWSVIGSVLGALIGVMGSTYINRVRLQDPADDWTEHISSSGKKYYYNCRTEVSQWEKPKDLLEREQRQKDSAKMGANSFPKDMDYRQEALQDKATTKTTSGDQSTSSNSSLSSSLSSSQSLNSAAGSLGSAPSNMSSSSSSTVQGAPCVQSQSSALLQDPAVLHQFLPALQATLQMNNGNMDMAKLNEVLAAAVTQASLRSVLHKLLAAGPAFNVSALLSAAQHSNQAQHSSQSPVSMTTDASSPRPYVSPRNGTPQNNQKPLGVHIGSVTPSQTRGGMPSGKQGSGSLCQTTEKRPEDPRTLQQRR